MASACAAVPQAQARPTGTWTCSDMLGTRRVLDVLTKEHTTMIATGDHSEAVTERVEMAETEIAGAARAAPRIAAAAPAAAPARPTIEKGSSSSTWSSARSACAEL